MKDLQKLMNDISEWSDATFGEGQRNPAIVHHLVKEVPELIEAIDTCDFLSRYKFVFLPHRQTRNIVANAKV